jgi:hypothetical protein
MCHDVAHAAHFSKGEFGDGLPGRRGQMRRGLADDFNASDNGVLFLLVCAKISLARVSDVGADQPRGFQDVAQSAELVSFHTSTRHWPKCARGHSGSAIFPRTGARQNQWGAQPILPPRRPFPAAQQSRPARTRRALLAGPRHYRAPLAPAPRNQKPLSGGWDVFRKMDAAAGAVRQKLMLADHLTSPQDNGSTRRLQGSERGMAMVEGTEQEAPPKSAKGRISQFVG